MDQRQRLAIIEKLTNKYFKKLANSVEPVKSGKLIIVNPNDKNLYKNKYLIQLGVYSTTNFLVYAKGYEHAVDEVIDYVADESNGLTGYLCNDQLQEVLLEKKQEFMDEGMSEEEAEQKAYDEGYDGFLVGGNSSDCLNSDEVFITENPSRSRLKELSE